MPQVTAKSKVGVPVKAPGTIPPLLLNKPTCLCTLSTVASGAPQVDEEVSGRAQGPGATAVPGLLNHSTPLQRPATNGWSDANTVNADTQLLTMHAWMMPGV